MKHTVHISEERRNTGIFWLCAAEIAGIAAGSVLCTGGHIPEPLEHLLCPAVSGGTLLNVFTGTALTSIAVIAAAFILGLFALGQLPSLLLMTVIGAMSGAAAALFYGEKGFSAIPAVLVLLLPKTIAVSAAVMLAVREAVRSSTDILRCINGSDQQHPGLRLYCIRFAVLTIIILIISAADSLLNYVFAGLV